MNALTLGPSYIPKTLRFNLLGDNSVDQEQEESDQDGEEDSEQMQCENDEQEVEVVHCSQEEKDGVDEVISDNNDSTIEENGVEKVISDDDVAVGINGSTNERRQGWGDLGRVALAKVKVSKGKLSPDRTVAARLEQLEQSLSSLMEKTEGQPPEPADHAAFEELSKRVSSVETFLHGLVQDEEHTCIDEIVSPVEGDEMQSDAAVPYDSQVNVVEGEARQSEIEAAIPEAAIPSQDVASAGVDSDGIENDSVSRASRSTERTAAHEGSTYPNEQLLQPPAIQRASSRRRGSLLSLLNERETRTGLSIDDLEQQVCSLRESIEGKQLGVSNTLDPGEIWKQFEELTDDIQEQVDKLCSSVVNKVSKEDLEAKIHELREALSSSCSTPETVDTSASSAGSSDELAIIKTQILEQLSKLESEKLDKGTLNQQLEQVEQGIKSFLGQEISKQQLDISTNAEKIENDLIEIRAIIDAQKDAILCLGESAPVPSSTNSSINEEEMDARIQQATDALRLSLEERLDELKSIESEMDGLASKLEEKPSQDQIDSMLQNMEKRLGQDEALQVILANMKMGKLVLMPRLSALP